VKERTSPSRLVNSTCLLDRADAIIDGCPWLGVSYLVRLVDTAIVWGLRLADGTCCGVPVVGVTAGFESVCL